MSAYINQELEAAADAYLHAFEYNASNQVVYKGDAGPGTAKSYAGWRISKFTYDANGNVTDIQWAGGTNTFSQIWNNRAVLVYS